MHDANQLPGIVARPYYLPVKRDSLFFNALYIYDANVKYERKLSEKMSIQMRGSMLHSSATLQYKGDKYGKLDRLFMLSPSLAMSYKTAHLEYSGGCNSYHTFIGDDSYFDIWPFSAWDAFLAHRTRIKRFHINSVSPFAGIEYRSRDTDEPGLTFSCKMTYNHHFLDDDILIKNRRVVLYLFLFSYEDLHFDFSDDLDAHLELKPTIYYHFSDGSIALEITQLAPIKWSKLTDWDAHAPSGPTGEKTNQWGGTQAQLSISVCF